VIISVLGFELLWAPTAGQLQLRSLPLASIGLSTAWRTPHRLGTKLGFLLWHALAVAMFVAPLFFFVWFAYQMRDH
jgi:hypothetical protein